MVGGLETLSPLAPGVALADAAHAQLSERILRNELSPGTPLSVPELARRLQISRSPVREAVQRLVYDGLADYRGRSGTFVSSLDISGFVSLLEVREVLEGLAARRAAERADDTELEELARVHASFTATRTASNSDLSELDMEFHRRIREMARNPEISTPLARAQARGHLSMHSLWKGARNVDAVRSEHEEILAAITSRDGDAAEEVARRHIAELRGRVLAELSGGED